MKILGREIVKSGTIQSMQMRMKSLESTWFRRITPGDVASQTGTPLVWEYGETHRRRLLVQDPMSSTIVMAAVRLLAEVVASVRFEVSDPNDNVLEQHPAAQIMDKGGGRWTRTDLIWSIVEGMLIAGNAVIIPDRRGEIEVVDWRNVILPMPGSGERVYRIRDRMTGTERRYSDGGVAHLRYRRSIDGWNGLGLVAQTALDELRTDREAQQYTLTLLQRMGVPGMIFSGKDTSPNRMEITDEDVNALQQGLDRLYSGGGRGGSLVTRNEWTIHEPVGISNRGIDLSPVRNVTEERLLASLGVPAAMVSIGVGAEQVRVGRTLEQLRIAFASDTIIPLCEHIADSLSAELLPFFGGTPGYLRFRPNYENCIMVQEREAVVKRQQAEYLLPLVQAGVLTKDEARYQIDPTLEALPPEPEPPALGMPGAGMLPPGMDMARMLEAAAANGNGNGNGNGVRNGNGNGNGVR